MSSLLLRTPTSSRFSSMSLCWLWSVGFVTTPLYAQTPVMENMIVVGSRQESSLLDRVGNATVLPQEQIEARSATHIQELLQTVPGVNLQRGSGQEYLPAIRSGVLSGAGACGALLMMQDGIPLRPLGFCNINELVEAQSENAQSVEIIRGPGNAFLGAGAMQGIINIRTIPLHPENRLALELNDHEYRRLKGSVGTALNETASMGANVSFTDDGGYRDSAGFEQQKMTLWQQSEGDDWRIRSGVTAVWHDQQTAGYITGRNSYRDLDLVRSNPNPDAYRELTAARIWTTLEQTLEQGGSTVLTLFGRNSSMEFIQHFLPGTPLESNGQTSAGLQLTQKRAFESFDLSYGVDMEMGDFYLRQTQEASTFAVYPSGRHYDYEVNQWMGAGFLQATWRFSELWTLEAGLRKEVTAYDYKTNLPAGRLSEAGTACPSAAGCRYNRPADREDSFYNGSYHFGVGYSWDAQTRYFLNFAQGFRPPQTTEMYRLQDAQSLADLNSESIRSLELGLRHFAEKASYEMVLYGMEKQEVIYLDSDRFYRNSGETAHWGVELGGDYQVASAVTLSANWTFSRNRFMHHSVSGSDLYGNDLDGAPEHFGTLGMEWRLSDQHALFLEYIRMGGYYADAENEHRYSGHNLFNLRSTWILNPEWKASIRVVNLGDTRYAERADFTTFSGERYFPGEPRTVSVGVEWHW